MVTRSPFIESPTIITEQARKIVCRPGVVLRSARDMEYSIRWYFFIFAPPGCEGDEVNQT